MRDRGSEDWARAVAQVLAAQAVALLGSIALMNVPSDLQADFENARAATGQWTERPDNASLLKLYALYKQGSLGDNDQPRPGFSDPVARAKWDAWNALKGLSRQDAMAQYIALVESLS